jgi:putative ABC transport system permease protein
MHLANVLRQLSRDLRGQRLRTFLTIFGIVWGTVAVSLLLAFGQGFHRQVAKNSAGLGENIVIAWPSMTSIPFEGLGKGRRIRLVEEDVDLIRAQAEGLAAVSAEYSKSLKLVYGTRTLAVDAAGVRPVFGEIRNLIPQKGGRFLDPIDEALERRVAFLGNKLAEDLFKKDDPLGRTLLLQGSPFLVIGILQKKEQDSNYSGPDDQKLFLPGSTFRALTGEKYMDNLVFKASTSSKTPTLKDDVIRILAKKYRFDPKDKEALSMWDTTQMFQFLDSFMIAFRSFLAVVGSLTLVVGGIGVSNIMNVVVEERTREIGIKMALGARAGSILVQFLLETLAVTGLGGVLGLAISGAVCAVFPLFGLTEYVGRPAISPSVALITSALLGAVGLLAGWFPAREAARLDPVVAMKL